MLAPYLSPFSGLYREPFVAKWNLTFDGTTEVNQILEWVSELSSARHVSEEPSFHEGEYRQKGGLFVV